MFRSASRVAIHHFYFRAAMRRLQTTCPWNLIAAVFALALAAGLPIKGFLDLHRLERLVPLSALALGLGFCFWTDTRSQKAHRMGWMRLVPAVPYAFFVAARPHQPLHSVRLPVSANLIRSVKYAFLAVLWSWFCLPVLARRGSLAFGGWAFLPGILFTLSDEWHQSWVPERFCSVWNGVLDAFGLCAEMAAVTALSHWALLWHSARQQEPV